MEKQFWIKRWQDDIIGFHKQVANPLLINYLPNLNLAPQARVLIPLCGKSLDIQYLLLQGHRVVGVELSEKAIIQLFKELDIIPKIIKLKKLIHYSATNLDIYVGDLFETTKEIIGAVDAIYDRAALIALPLEMRIKYSKHLTNISNCAAQLLITIEYDQNELQGPPFSITSTEVNDHYANLYKINNLESLSVPDGLKGKYKAHENVWLLN
jgi:thiopurine S-methyltransferase